ncbi:MAG: tetratricopeptide repeat protein [Hydrococcus sp. RM1_1_31]|nr:tetratricopeptide repeat protein [Hydrococcus sp. RM1_1_31]
MEKYQESVEACDRAIQIEPEFYQAYYVKGLTLFTQNQWPFVDSNQVSEALEAVDRTLEIQPNFYEALRLRADLLRSLGRFAEAIEPS